MNARGDFLEQLFAGRLFEQPHNRLDLGVELHPAEVLRGLVRRDTLQTGQETKIAQPGSGAGGSRILQETSARIPFEHGAALPKLDRWKYPPPPRGHYITGAAAGSKG